jgi:ABC-type branched-subunit amino acid transport system substrate-binding protein
MKRGISLYWMLVLAFALVVSGVARAQTQLSPQELRGKQIYTQGTSASGKEIFAYIGESSLEVPGATMACVSCHGTNGQGKPEGGIEPSNITWEALTKPYGVTHVSGRKHPPYTDRAVELAVTRGVDPAGNRLLFTMPRYQMTKEDLADLIVYLKRLGTDTDPGITENRIVIGTALPARGPLAEMGQAVKEVIAASFAELNARGGIYNRQLELKAVETGENAAATRANIESFIKTEKVFAMTGAFLAGSETDVLPLLAEQQVPLIGPLTLNPKLGTPLNRQVFYLLSGNAGQARALINFVAQGQQAQHPTFAVVYSPSELNTTVFEAIKSQIQKENLKAPAIVEYTSGNFDAVATVKRLQQDSTVFFLGAANDLVAFVNEAAKVNWFPQILMQAGGASADIFKAPAGFDGKLLLTVPSSPSDLKTEAVSEYQALAQKYKLPPNHFAAQLSAYAATKLLIEGLQRVGKDLSRERLIQALEGFYEYQTGLTPAITWGPNRRIGAMGAYVVRIDLKEKKAVAASGWVSIN